MKTSHNSSALMRYFLKSPSHMQRFASFAKNSQWSCLVIVNGCPVLSHAMKKSNSKMRPEYSTNAVSVS